MFPLDVSGELSLLGEGGERVRVAGRGELISVELPGLRAGRSLAAQTAGRARRVAAIARLQESLRGADLSLQLCLAGRTVARLTPHSRATLLSRLLGLGTLEIMPAALLGAILLRRESGP